MTEQRDAEPAIFRGAQRAEGYVESEYTIHGPEAEEVRQAAARIREQDAHPVPRDEAPVDETTRSRPTRDRTAREQVPAPAPAVATLPPIPAQKGTIPPLPPTPSTHRGTLAAELEAQPPVDALTALKEPASAPKRVAQKGVRGGLAKIGIRLAPSSTELVEVEAAEAERAHQVIIRQTTWTHAVGVLVANPKGGTGKTPVALLLGGTLAAIRGGSVAVMEVSDDPGALTFRAEGNPQRGIGELVRDADVIQSAGQLAGYTAPQTSFASVIGSVGRRRTLLAEDVRAAADLVDDYYSIRVMDSGNQLSSSAFAGAVDTADALVIPVMNGGDAVLEAIALLDELRDSEKGSRLARNAVILRLRDGRPEPLDAIERIDRVLGTTNVYRLHEIPYDPHIAARGPLTLASLAPATRRAFVAAAASVVEALKLPATNN